jgi:hypothetical protein
VLELDGQFEILQPYYAESDDPALEIAGWVHVLCLASSPFRGTWVQWRIGHFTEARGYEIVDDRDGWTILHDRRRGEIVAFHVDGATVDAARAEGQAGRCDGGGYLWVERDSHLTIDDPAFVAAIQLELRAKQRVPLARVVDQLGIRDRLYWPAVLDSGEYVFSRQLRRDWGVRSFSARVRYQKFLPDPVLAVWNTL